MYRFTADSLEESFFRGHNFVPAVLELELRPMDIFVSIGLNLTHFKHAGNTFGVLLSSCSRMHLFDERLFWTSS